MTDRYLFSALDPPPTPPAANMESIKVILFDHFSESRNVYDITSLKNVLVYMVGKEEAKRIMIAFVLNKTKSFECHKNKRLFTITYYE